MRTSSPARVATARCSILVAALLLSTQAVLHARSASARSDYRPAPAGLLKGKIVFSPGKRATSLWIMNADGSHKRQLTHPGRRSDYSPSWSPDGKRIVFRSERGHYVRDPRGSGAQGIFVIDVRTGREHEVEPRTGGLFPAWAPNGKTIALTVLNRPRDGESIALVDPDGSHLHALRMQTLASECSVWSPDSRQIAFCGHMGDGNWAVWVTNADGSGQRQLTHPQLVQPAGSGGDEPCAWSPDGTEILYSSGQEQSRELYAVRVDDGSTRRLTHWDGGDSASAWLPDGRIVFAHWATPNALLPRWYVMNGDGSEIHSLPQLDRARAGDPIAWLPGR